MMNDARFCINAGIKKDNPYMQLRSVDILDV